MFSEPADNVSSIPTTLMTALAPKQKEKEVNPVEVLAELYELLKAYSPQWYTEEHHRRAQIALRGRTQESQNCPENAVSQPSKR